MLEKCLDESAVTVGLDMKPGTQGVDRLGTYSVQSDAELEHVVVVLGACVDLGHAVDDLSQRDSSSVVTDADLFVLEPDGDPVAGSHDELIDAVVDDFLHENIYSVVHVGAVSQTADIHTGAQPDMLQRGHRLYRIFVIDRFLLSHNSTIITK